MAAPLQSGATIATMGFEELMQTLRKRSDATHNAGPPAWLTTGLIKQSVTHGPLSSEEVRSFYHDGFFIKHGLFTREELQPVRGEISTHYILVN